MCLFGEYLNPTMSKFDATINLLSGWIEKCTADSTLELEAKFCGTGSTGIGSGDAKPTQLKSYVNAATFYRVLNGYSNFKWQETKSDTVDAVVYLPNRVNARLTFPTLDEFVKFASSGMVQPAPLKCLIKTIKQSNEDLEYNVKYSLAKETPIEWNSIDAKPSGVQSIRHKNRTTFDYKFVKYDFTVVHTYKYDFRKQTCEFTGLFHEIELEFVGGRVKPGTFTKDLVNSYFKYIQTIQQFIQDSKYLISNSEASLVKSQISQISQNGLMMLGPQPDTLQQNHLTKVMSKMYAVSPKLDGERRLLFVNDKGYIYLIDRNHKITKHAKAKPSNVVLGCVLDGEFLKKSPPEFHVFDILAHGGTDLRENIKFGLLERLEIMHKVLENLRTSSEDLMIFPKKHYTSDKMMYLESLSEGGLPNGVDGLIFTPVHEPLPLRIRWQSLFKWKPPQFQTIDFQICNGKACVSDVGNQLIPFEPAAGSHFDDPSLEGCVVECIYDQEKSKWIVSKLRYDKQKPNFKMVGVDVWNAIQNPVTLSDFKGNHFSDLRAFHNRIKHDVLKEFTADSESVDTLNILDLCCGRGSDFHKYKHTGIQKVIGVDKHVESINEARLRHPHSVFIAGDLRDPKVWASLPCVDIIVCHFAIHYFFESYEIFDDFCYNLSQHLKDNGVLILSYLDGDTVLKYLFDIHSQRRKETHNGSTFNISFTSDLESYNFSQLHKFGVPVDVQMVGEKTNYLSQKSNEYLVYSDILCDVMEKHNLCFDYSKPFSDLYDQSFDKLNDDEQEYSFMNRLIVFKKVESKIGRFENFISDNKLDTIFDIPRKAFGTLNTRLMTIDQLTNVLSKALKTPVTALGPTVSIQNKLSHLSSQLNLIIMILDASNDVLDIYMHQPVEPRDLGIIVFLGSKDSVQLVSTVPNGIFFPCNVLINMAASEDEAAGWSPQDELNVKFKDILSFSKPIEPIEIEPVVVGSVTGSVVAPIVGSVVAILPLVSAVEIDTEGEIEPSAEAKGEGEGEGEAKDGDDFFLGRPIASGSRSERWSLEDVKELSKKKGWKIPSIYRRKEEMITYIKQHYLK